MYCLSTAKTVGNTGFFVKSYKNNRTKKADTPMGICFFGMLGTRKGGTSAHTGVKIESWRAIFSPWESPLYSRCIRYGCRWNINFSDSRTHWYSKTISQIL